MGRCVCVLGGRRRREGRMGGMRLGAALMLALVLALVVFVDSCVDHALRCRPRKVRQLRRRARRLRPPAWRRTA